MQNLLNKAQLYFGDCSRRCLSPAPHVVMQLWTSFAYRFAWQRHHAYVLRLSLTNLDIAATALRRGSTETEIPATAARLWRSSGGSSKDGDIGES